MDKSIIRVRLCDGVHPRKYRRIEKGVVYSISFLNKHMISFVNVSGSYHSKFFCLVDGTIIPTKYVIRFNVFNDETFEKNHYVLCLENYLYKDLKIGGVYRAEIVMNGYFETNKVSINGKEYKKSTFMTLTKEEATKALRVDKLEELGIKKEC